MNRKLKIIVAIVIGVVITNLLELIAPEYLLNSEVMIKSVWISFAWFMVFVGVSYGTYRLLEYFSNRKDLKKQTYNR